METGKSSDDPETGKTTSGPGILQTSLAALYYRKNIQESLDASIIIDNPGGNLLKTAVDSIVSWSK